jgi:hypothetical protein
MPKISVNLLTIVDRRIFNGILNDINNGKKAIPVVDNYMTPRKQLGHVVPGSAKIVGDLLMCDVEVEEPVELEPVYIRRPAQLLALEKSSAPGHFPQPIECVPIENGGTKRGKGQRSK